MGSPLAARALGAEIGWGSTSPPQSAKATTHFVGAPASPSHGLMPIRS